MNAATVEQLEAEVSTTCTRLTVLLIALDVLEDVGTMAEVSSLRGRVDALTADLGALRASLAAEHAGSMPPDDQDDQDAADEEYYRLQAIDDHQQRTCDPETCRLCREDEP